MGWQQAPEPVAFKVSRTDGFNVGASVRARATTVSVLDWRRAAQAEGDSVFDK